MSATLDPAWLKTVDFTPADWYRAHDLAAADLAQARHLWSAGKALRRLDLSGYGVGKKDGLASYAAAFAREARSHTKPGTNTIVFVNTVARAQAVFAALGSAGEAERLLVHSRLIKTDRDRATRQLLAPPPSGRITVTTQALEAGVDVTSATMITEIAPWSLLVQRLGRCNRYGECGDAGAHVFWVDLDDIYANPYTAGDFAATRDKLASLTACGPADLAAILPSPPPPGHMIRRRDMLDLFDTHPDLSGFDVDVSLYVRDADDTDVRLFWRPIPAEADAPPNDAPAAVRDELCPAPVGGARALMAHKGVRAWRWDALARTWRSVGKDDVFPGVMIWIDAASGGYDSERGFDPSATATVAPMISGATPETGLDDEPDAFTSTVRISLAQHSTHVRDQLAALCEAVGMRSSECAVLVEAALWHDLGKAHEAFVALTAEALTDGVASPLAKWPTAMTARVRPPGTRRYFRHELASALAYLARREWSEEASLGAYLIAAHHGKVRMRLQPMPGEPPPSEAGRLFAHGVHDGDSLPETCLDGIVAAATRLDLDLMQLGEFRQASTKGICGVGRQLPLPDHP